MTIDIIGDVHGHADRLEALLTRLGYRRRGGAWRHPHAMAIFVGDFIDRGPHQLRTLELVRGMLDAGSARAVMGNHELNAIGFATADPLRQGEFLRRRSVKHTRQHAAFLEAVGLDSALHRSWIDWCLELPLWIETPQLRVVHACWNPDVVTRVRAALGGSDRLPPERLARVFTRGDSLRDDIEVLLKGPELRLPEGADFIDKDGHTRTEIRTRWWAPELQTYAQVYIGPQGAAIPDLPVPDHVSRSLQPDRPTFIGHYWLEPDARAAILSERVACVDFSVAADGRLAAYRFDGEAELDAERFVAV